MAGFTAFLDASVLYPAPLRDLLLELAVSDFYRAKWSNAVHEEWIDALLRSRDDLTRKRLRGRSAASILNPAGGSALGGQARQLRPG